MKRTISLFVAALALMAVLVAPATAAPKKVYTWTVTCGADTYTVKAPLGVPGWPEIGKSPALLVGGTFTTYDADGNQTDQFSNPVPAGLVSRVKTCKIVGPQEADAGFTIVSDPAYFLFTG